MLKLLRGGSPSLAKSLFALQVPLQSKALITSRISLPACGRNLPFYLTRSLCSTSQLHSNSYATEKSKDDVEQNEFSGSSIRESTRKADSSENGHVTKFHELAERNMVCDTVVNTIVHGMRLDTMTPVQSMTINETLNGVDVLAQARTGTGKTLAFLIPVLQNIITKDPSLEKQQRPFRRSTPPDIRAIIISPTRELAEQIAVEAQRVVRNTGVIVQTAVGGMNKAHGMRKIKTEGCHILVGTPGRLEDILQDPYSCIETPKLSAFVLDEADRLLDDGFAQDIQNILRLLPERSAVDRQSLMFSATMPKEVMQMVRSIMKPSYKFVQTVQPGEADTHLKVPQKLVQVAGLENLMPVLLELCKRELANKDAETPFKAIVFFGATSEAKLAKSVFQNLVSSDDRFAPHLLHPMALIEMHAKLGQQQRTRNAETFRQCKTGIMFSSDVSARGMDFPNVSHVIQIGLPSTRDVYVHRLGRTGRRGRTGQGWLLLTAPEMREASHRLPNLPLAVDNTLKTAAIDMTQDADLPASVAETLNQVVKATRRIPEEFKAAAYKATLGIYSWMPSKQGLINLMNNRSKYGWGLATPPNLSAAVVQKLGLRSLEGVNVGPTLYEGKFKPESGHDRDALGQGNSRGYRPGGRFQSGHHGGRGGSPGGYSGGRGGYAGGYSGGPGGSPGGYAGSRGGSSGGYSGGREFGDRRGSGDRGGDGQGRSYGNRGGEAARNFLG